MEERIEIGSVPWEKEANNRKKRVMATIEIHTPDKEKSGR